MNDDQIIERLGGSAQVARLCEITVGAVSQWKGTGIPRARRQFLRLLHPEAFADPAPELTTPTQEAEHA